MSQGSYETKGKGRTQDRLEPLMKVLDYVVSVAFVRCVTGVCFAEEIFPETDTLDLLTAAVMICLLYCQEVLLNFQ